MFAVAGISGHTGKVVAQTLLAQNKPVRVIVRDGAKGDVTCVGSAFFVTSCGED